jgi:hypothetical protein
MNQWSVVGMANRLNWEKRQFDRKQKLSVADETEFRENDVAATWIRRAEERLQKSRETGNHLRYDEDARRKQLMERSRLHKQLRRKHRRKSIISRVSNPELADIPGYLYRGEEPPW